MTYVDTLTIRLTISPDVIGPPTHELPIITFSDNKPYLALTTKDVAAADNQPAFLELLIITHSVPLLFASDRSSHEKAAIEEAIKVFQITNPEQ